MGQKKPDSRSISYVAPTPSPLTEKTRYAFLSHISVTLEDGSAQYVRAKVRFLHLTGERVEVNGPITTRIQVPVTICQVALFTPTDTNPLRVYQGEAFCSLLDQMFKSTGRKQALAKAMRPMTRMARVNVWLDYRMWREDKWPN